jgi:ATP-dependent exoDNAse (exonuclease V) beta subunit
MQFWSYAGECTDAVIEHAVKDVVGEWCLTERVARVRQVLDAQSTCQPALFAELRVASTRGELFHEVSVGYLRQDGAWVEGVIDLLYRDAGGDWHVVDYKTDRVADDTALHAKFEEYYPHVRAYADALNGQLPGGAVVKTIRLWMIGAGCVGSWTACPSHA